MAGRTSEHSAIGANLLGALVLGLKGKSCRPYNSDQRIKSSDTGLHIYPDASVFCGLLEYDDEDSEKHTATNPTALFEVLSESTEAYDRGFKFECFRKCESLRAFVLIAQDRPHVEVFFRDETRESRWSLDEATGLEETIDVPGIGVTLQLADLYDRVEFPPQEEISS